jgi:hypothetical protein
MRTVTPLMKIDISKLIYFSLSAVHHVICLLGKCKRAKEYLTYIQNKIIEIITGFKKRVSCRELY